MQCLNSSWLEVIKPILEECIEVYAWSVLGGGNEMSWWKEKGKGKEKKVKLSQKTPIWEKNWKSWIWRNIYIYILVVDLREREKIGEKAFEFVDKY